MDTIISLKSRGVGTNYLKLLHKPDKSESKTYVLKTDSPTVRIGYINDKKMIDPPGGPMIIEGDILEEVGIRVKNIDFIAGYGHTITFE